MSFVRSVRPSNLVILAALPFIVYLFASSPDYQRSLRAILGVELGSSAFVPGFLLLAVAFSAGFAVLVLSRSKIVRPRLTIAAGLVSLVATAAIIAGDLVHPFIASVVANGVDSFKSDLVVKGATPRQLTEAADLMVRGVEAWLWPAYAVLLIAGLALLFCRQSRASAGRKPRAPGRRLACRPRQWCGPRLRLPLRPHRLRLAVSPRPSARQSRPIFSQPSWASSGSASSSCAIRAKASPSSWR